MQFVYWYLYISLIVNLSEFQTVLNVLKLVYRINAKAKFFKASLSFDLILFIKINISTKVKRNVCLISSASVQGTPVFTCASDILIHHVCIRFN